MANSLKAPQRDPNPVNQPYSMKLPSSASMEVFNSSQKLNDLVVSGLALSDYPHKLMNDLNDLDVLNDFRKQ
jgi:hypothetical protein